ncbi:formate/nitrite transporter family protein [Microbulbifer sp. CAU 1566]|uniref:formate/nitrite transporter family protein n=1 Tax=Microbulbifer sp. CAU 1566 TaxID=2933269 RepID=UPI002003DADC|nr:formate/nitrite transporter family protein [Microbulbifer sp. CAU 1566]MCK7598037.1 formate/nitrite transporter family protein [Microbulbifer sp. CAU 1566]
MNQRKDNDRPKSDRQILWEQMDESLREYQRNNKALLLSSVAAGMEIGFSLFLIAAFYSHFHGNISHSLLYLLTALSYPIGFILVVIGRSDLFTEHTTLAILPVLDGRKTVRQLMRVWGLIYAGNLLGAALFSALFVQFVGMTDRFDDTVFSYYGAKMTSDYVGGQFLGAIFAGWLMGLLAWMVTSSTETISRITAVALITFVIGLGGLPHCIAGAVGMFSAWFSEGTTVGFAEVAEFLAIATIGNTIGGSVFVGRMKYSFTARRDSHRD